MIVVVATGVKLNGAAVVVVAVEKFGRDKVAVVVAIGIVVIAVIGAAIREERTLFADEVVLAVVVVVCMGKK